LEIRVDQILRPHVSHAPVHHHDLPMVPQIDPPRGKPPPPPRGQQGHYLDAHPAQLLPQRSQTCLRSRPIHEHPARHSAPHRPPPLRRLIPNHRRNPRLQQHPPPCQVRPPDQRVNDQPRPRQQEDKQQPPPSRRRRPLLRNVHQHHQPDRPLRAVVKKTPTEH